MFYLQSNALTRSIIMLLLFIFGSSSTFAATPLSTSKSKQQNIDIQANYLLLDEGKGISQYKGNVLFTKDTLSIKADTVTLYYDGEQLTKALIKGSPADVHHQPDNEDKVHSQANIMEFFVTEDRLTLKGSAFVDQGDRHFSGEYIEYDTRQRTLTATGGQQGSDNKKPKDFAKNSPQTTEANSSSGRVHVIIGPDENNENKENLENE